MKQKKAEMEKDENGHRYLTEKYIIDLCEENQQYLTPRFNTCLYLHYKGFSRIQALENYTGLKCLWLEGNGIQAIENIEHLTELRTMYLHQNVISKIEGLSTFSYLVTLNLSHNHIKVIENLSGCSSLKNLDLSHNMIVNYKDCEGLRDVPTITSIDLSFNYIEYDDEILNFFFEFQQFLCFYFKNNPALRKIKMYRKTLINGFKNLLYLDDRPVKELDRLAAQAWAEGGVEKETEVRKAYMEAQINRMRTHTQKTREVEEEGRRHRARQLELIKADTKLKKDKLLERQTNLRELIRTARHSAEEKNKIELELKVVDQELNNDMFEIINEDKIVVPPMRRVADQKNQPEYHERLQRERRERLEKEEMERRIKEYNERERIGQPKAQSVIPSPSVVAPKVRSKAQRMREEGVVMSTDSESENDPTIFAKRAGYRQEIFFWDEFYENKLEEILITNMFDFTKSAYDFSNLVNNFDDMPIHDRFYYEITPKILQMKWTDVEIKKFRIQEFKKDREEDIQYANRNNEEVPDLECFDTDDPVNVISLESSKVTEIIS